MTKTFLHAPGGTGERLRARVHGRGCNILFVHGTIGGHLLADPTDDRMGGGLRGLLEGDGHAVHQAYQGSELGELTDRHDFPPKLGVSFDRLSRTEHQDTLLPGEASNDVIVFKSCFRQNKLRPDIAKNTTGPTPTAARAALMTLRRAYAKHPDTHFVWMTTPPFEPRGAEGLVKRRARALLKMDDAAMGERASALNRWTVDPDGWLAGYDVGNVSIFDYFTVLTGGRPEGLLDYAGSVRDRPSKTGQRLAAKHFVHAMRALLA